MTKGALDSFGPFTLLVLQLTASVAVLWLAVAVLRLRLPSIGATVRTSSTGLLEPGLAYALGVPGLALTTASNATVVASLEPVFILILAWLLFGAVIRRLSMLAIALSIVGVALVSLARPGIPLQTSFTGSETVQGDALVLLGTLFAALYVISSSRLVQAMPATLLTALQQTAGLALTVGFLAFALAIGSETLPVRVAPGMLSLAIASGVIQYALAFWLYIVGLKRIPPGVAGLFLTTTPVFGILGGIVFLGERITSLQLFGVGLVVFGLCWVLSLERRT